MRTTYKDRAFCEEKECMNYVFIRATMNRPCIGLVAILPEILESCKKECPYSKADFISWHEEKLMKRLGLKS